MLSKEDVTAALRQTDGHTRWLIALLSGLEQWPLRGQDMEHRAVAIGKELGEPTAATRLRAAERGALAGFLTYSHLERFFVALNKVSEIAPDVVATLSRDVANDHRSNLWWSTSVGRVQSLGRCGLATKIFGPEQLAVVKRAASEYTILKQKHSGTSS